MVSDELTPGSWRDEAAAFVWETFKIVLVSLVIIIPVRVFIVQPFFVKGASMESNFHDKDYVIVNKIDYRLNSLQRGDVVVFQWPNENPQEYFIKRVIGLPGEIVDIRENTVTIINAQYPQGFQLKEKYLDSFQQTFGTISKRLDDDEYFVLGDNREHSSDSRIWGAVKRVRISGRAWLRLWPLTDLGFIPRVVYTNP